MDPAKDGVGLRHHPKALHLEPSEAIERLIPMPSKGNVMTALH